MYKFVETLKKTYLCESVVEEGVKTKLINAEVISNDFESQDISELAKQYIRSGLLSHTKNLTLSTKSIESIQDAEDVSPLIDLMSKYIPLAEKNARANAILNELEAYIGASQQED